MSPFHQVGAPLDEAYYDFLKSMVRAVDGIPVLDEAAIIPFKARAWVDLSVPRSPWRTTPPALSAWRKVSQPWPG